MIRLYDWRAGTVTRQFKASWNRKELLFRFNVPIQAHTAPVVSMDFDPSSTLLATGMRAEDSLEPVHPAFLHIEWHECVHLLS